MKVKCNNCGKIVNKKKFENNIKELSIDKDDYINIYLCKKCRSHGIGLFVSDYLNWDDISKYQRLTEPFIEKYKDKVNWWVISKYQKLSESFVEKYKDELNWDHISRYQKLSEQFMEKYKRYVIWDCVSRYQNLSPEFVQKHIDKITSNILNNPCYKSYPDSLKSLLKVKFDKRRVKI